jgi:hypothetical protein
VDVVEVDQPQGARVLEQDGQDVATFEEFPVMEAVVAEAALLRIDEVELPYRHVVPRDAGGQVAATRRSIARKSVKCSAVAGATAAAISASVVS